MTEETDSDSFLDQPVHRRRFLQWSAGIGGAALLGGLTRRAATKNGLATRSSSAADTAASVEEITLTPTLIAAAKKEGTLLLRYSDPQPCAEIWADAFKKAYGIEVQLDRKVGILGNQAFATEQQAGKHVMDVNHNSDPLGLVQLDAEGYYLHYDLPDVNPHIPKVAKLRQMGYCEQIVQVCIGYNPQKISSSAADQLFSSKNWNGLLDPSLAGGKIGLTEPGGGSVPYGTYQMLYQSPKYGPGFLTKLAKQGPKLYAGSAPGLEDLASGAISVYATSWTATAMETYVTGNQTQWTYTSDIMPSFPDIYSAINKDAPHPNAARLFVAWLMSAEGASATQQAQVVPIRTDVTIDPPAYKGLKTTTWWKPFPAKEGDVPNLDYWIKNYNTLMPEMRQTFGYQAT
jgi:iron(III) transport system substrate-binding protein